MSFKVEIATKVAKSLVKLGKTRALEHDKILNFLYKRLATSENPCALPNCKKLQGFSDNRYRWRLGDYRIIGIVENGEFKIIQIIKISKRNENTYKGL